MAPSELAASLAFAVEDDLPPCSREASFSSYLGAVDRGLSQRPSGEFTDKNPTASQTSLEITSKKKAGDMEDEIDVFGAEKYFSSAMEGDELVAKLEKPWKLSPVKEAGFPGGMTSWSGTPSEFSKTSWNSRSSILKDGRKDLFQGPRRSPRPTGSKRFLGIFRCSCSDESSVRVDDNNKGADGRKPASWPSGPNQVQPESECNEKAGWRRTSDKEGGGGSTPKWEDYSAFPPALNSTVVVGNLTVAEVFDVKRKGRTPSMDVFPDASFGKEVLGASSFLRSPTTSPAFSTTCRAARDSDVGSESSSDLFEIEHLPAGVHPLGSGGTAATPCYEPSEASIEWSVVTASAANFSTASDAERCPPEERKKAGGRQQRQRPGGLLLGCGSHKSVRTASNTHRMPEIVETADGLRRNRSMNAASPAIGYLAELRQSADLERRLARHILVGLRAVPVPTAHLHCS